jgi:hypothetical protein
VDDFQSISLVQWRLRPLVAGYDFAVQFDRYPVRLHGKLFDQRA